jgi:hypothetical protein
MEKANDKTQNPWQMTRRAIFSMFHSPFLSTSVKKEEEKRIYSPEESSELELFAESEG